ncbi:HDOD domain-containing protein [Desulfobotulus sp. H1]|uniref:HDOD domain-containing protein n=1 Tax=Desulfobotulus pelophilus TaxID=2823377 RepID=A0ABT3N706_9BACT|nr:HDOD domain-containing protein [Desulfobotulus pelophilus]MCW7753243.1 HDOD domain-containing protein [Desulfobotulus pelophilus]
MNPPDSYLTELMEAAEKLPSLPGVVLTVNSMLQDPDTHTQDLSRMIAKDIALVTRILKLVNSAFFGLRSRVGSIPDAVSLLGFDTLHRITLALSIVDMLKPSRKNQGEWLWQHSIRTAVFSEYLANKTKICNGDNAFVAGLLHDMGLIVLARCMPGLFLRLEREAKNLDKPFYIMESSVIPGFSHASLGAAMARKWQLPPALAEAIFYHHRFPSEKPVSDMTIIVHTANALDTHSQRMRNEFPDAILHPAALTKFRHILKDPDQWFPEIHQRSMEACKLFLGDNHEP